MCLILIRGWENYNLPLMLLFNFNDNENLVNVIMLKGSEKAGIVSNENVNKKDRSCTLLFQ